MQWSSPNGLVLMCLESTSPSSTAAERSILASYNSHFWKTTLQLLYNTLQYSGPSLIRTPWDQDWSVCVKCLYITDGS